MTSLEDPRTLHESPPLPDQEQTQPGLTDHMQPSPDHGEESYVGHGRLVGRRALITGGDSGIGRAVAIAYAREGADLSISYLPQEQEDAERTATLVRDAGRECVLLPGDIREESTCISLIDDTVFSLGGIDLLVLNAGVQHRRDPAAQIDRASIMEVFETNLVAPLLLMREAAS
ncbi:MAG: SDR family NAD(P)-dependent oxidoreductase, partial [Microbacteriaceae bacterium]|nr:SDR family NAD(P)-dependent oxidoreductase [Microbacteriaceae bacterium]